MDNPYSDDWGVNVGTVVAGDTSTYALKVTMAVDKGKRYIGRCRRGSIDESASKTFTIC